MGLNREDFLEEAQYLAGLPDRLDLLDETTADRVRQALSAHPWVETVHQVYVSVDGVKADLKYRIQCCGSSRRGRRRCGGMLLPVAAKGDGLPVLAGTVKPPAGRPGQSWGDAGVEAAAKVAARLSLMKEIAGLRIAVFQGDIILRREGSWIVWGRPPGEERLGEPNAEEKVKRLVKARRDGLEVDLRK